MTQLGRVSVSTSGCATDQLLMDSRDDMWTFCRVTVSLSGSVPYNLTWDSGKCVTVMDIAQVLACRQWTDTNGQMLWHNINLSCVTLCMWTSNLCVVLDFSFIVPLKAYASGKSTIGSNGCYIHSSLPWMILNFTLSLQLCSYLWTPSVIGLYDRSCIPLSYVSSLQSACWKSDGGKLPHRWKWSHCVLHSECES